VVEGIGLRNTRSRLAALYGDAFELGLSGAPGRVVATLRLPISPAPA
jgi:sensor histidine kinase YesM